MTTSNSIFQSRLLSLICNALLTVAWVGFAYAHLSAFHATTKWIYLFFFASETLIALMYLVRSDPESVSTNPIDWVLAISATIAPLLFSPSTTALVPFAKFTLAIGVLIQIAGLISLNRSFGIVPARRKIKTRGLYRIVRHPLYASYLISNTSYVLTNTSIANVLLCITLFILLYVRLQREEVHLAMDAEYRRYMEEVPYRVIPFVL